MQVIHVHGTSLEGNLEADPPDWDSVMYLPAIYSESTARRYAGVYFLPSFMEKAERWFGPDEYWTKLLPFVARRFRKVVVPFMQRTFEVKEKQQ